MTKQFITLMTDFGLADGFVGMMKGVIYGINPNATIIDISHEIGSQDVLEAAFLLHASYRYFPRGTVHVVVVDPGVGSQRRAIAVETQEYYFVAPKADDTFDRVTALFEEANLQVRKRTCHEDGPSLVFHVRAMGSKADHERLRISLAKSNEFELRKW